MHAWVGFFLFPSSLFFYSSTPMFDSRYIFPGLALGAALGQTGVITNAMINRAAEV